MKTLDSPPAEVLPLTPALGRCPRGLCALQDSESEVDKVSVVDISWVDGYKSLCNRPDENRGTKRDSHVCPFPLAIKATYTTDPKKLAFPREMSHVSR